MAGKKVQSAKCKVQSSRVESGELPVGWDINSFEDVISRVSNGIGGNQNKTGNGIPVSRIETIACEKIDFSRVGYISEIESGTAERYRLLPGDILFSHINSPAHLGKTAIYTGSKELFHGINLLRITVNPLKTNPAYFRYNCKLLRLLGVFALNAQHAVNQSSINQKKLAQFEIPLAPLAEQKVIAEKLDALLAQVDSLKARLDAIPAILKRFRQSVLSAAVSGKLTEDWRGNQKELESAEALISNWLDNRLKANPKMKQPVSPDATNGIVQVPKNWIVGSVSQFAECLDSQRIPIKRENRLVSKGLYPYFGANGEVDRVDEFIFDDDIVLVTEDETFYGREKPIAYKYKGKCWVNNHVHVLKAPCQIANSFLCYSLMHYKVEPWLTGTTGRAKLTQGALNSLPIAIPPLPEQTEIVRRVEQLFAFADQVETRVKAAQGRVQHLTQAILAKAFRGELTADWREAHAKAQ